MEKSKYKLETNVKISDFFDEGEIEVTVKRPSLLSLAKGGKIPNSLIGTVNDIFSNNDSSDINIKEMSQLLHLIAKETLVEPTYKELEDILTDRQLIEIYHLSQGGVSELKSFRKFKSIS